MSKEAHPGDVVVMAGETLQYMSNGALPACLHRVVSAPAPRMSAVFNLRAPGGMVFDSAALTSAQTGPFPTPFRHTMRAFAMKHLAGRENVNDEPVT